MENGFCARFLKINFQKVLSDKIFKTKSEQILRSDKVTLRTKESLYYYELYRKYFEPPYTLHSSKIRCPNCKYKIKSSSKFCQMCGSFPI